MTEVTPAGDLWHIAGDLSALRSQRIESLVRTENFACIYAECPGSEPPANLHEAAEGAADQQHYELLRALVPLNSPFHGHEADTTRNPTPAHNDARQY